MYEFPPYLKSTRNQGQVMDPRLTFQISDAKVLIFDPTLFKLNLLLTMTQHNFGESENSFARLHYKYSAILRRRLWWMFSNNHVDNNNSVNNTNDGHFRLPPPQEFQDPDELHIRILSSIQTLEKISNYLGHILKSSNCVLPRCLR